MTEDYKQMKHLVEKAGRCWHEWALKFTEDTKLPYYECKCGAKKGTNIAKHCHANHSPHSVDALLELAKELGFRYKIARYSDGVYVWLARGEQELDSTTYMISQMKEDSDALRLAMCRATGWKEK